MPQIVRFAANPRHPIPEGLLAPYDQRAADRAVRLHESFPGYAPTPLRRLEGLADACGVGMLYLKDESPRFGLNAFKALGGSYGIAQAIAERLSLDPETLTYAALTAPALREKLAELTFVTATDGNHGRGIAWTAHQLGAKSYVYMPKVSSQQRLRNIQMFATHAEITPYNYDETVQHVFQLAREHGWIVTQDTAFDGYTEFPAWCQQGYLTLCDEVRRQLEDFGEKPTHIFIQAGVGTLAAAVAAYAAAIWGEDRPVLTVVEPLKADCLYQSARMGKLTAVGGDLDSIMAGLSCGVPSTVAWEILRHTADGFIACDDPVSARGMRMLAAPPRGDTPVISGESGAVGVGLTAELMREDCHAPIREALGLDAHSRVLCVSTEGDTDPGHYRAIVWEGQYPSI